jgi:hypothetical protein
VRRTLPVIAFVLLSCNAAFVHHSFPSYYFEQQTVTLTGELVEFDFRAPHAWVKIKSRDDSGEEQVFAAEWSNPNRLTRDGVSKTTLKIGDVVTIAGSPGRNPEERRLHLKAIERPADGWEWPQGRRR